MMISSATSFGNDSIATWLDGTSIAVALAAFTWSPSICGGNDRILRRNDHEGRLLAPRGLTHRSGKGSPFRSRSTLPIRRNIGNQSLVEGNFLDLSRRIPQIDQQAIHFCHPHQWIPFGQAG